VTGDSNLSDEVMGRLVEQATAGQALVRAEAAKLKKAIRLGEADTHEREYPAGR